MLGSLGADSGLESSLWCQGRKAEVRSKCSRAEAGLRLAFRPRSSSDRAARYPRWLLPYTTPDRVLRSLRHQSRTDAVGRPAC